MGKAFRVPCHRRKRRSASSNPTPIDISRSLLRYRFIAFVAGKLARSLTWGNGLSVGTSTPRKAHNGSQPSFTS